MVSRPQLRWQSFLDHRISQEDMIKENGLIMLSSRDRRTWRFCLGFTVAWILAACLSSSTWADLDCLHVNSLEWYADTCDDIRLVRLARTGSGHDGPLVTCGETIKMKPGISSANDSIPIPRYVANAAKSVESEWILFRRWKGGQLETLHFIDLAQPMAVSGTGELVKEPEAILNLLRDRVALNVSFPLRFDPNFIESFDPKSIGVSSFSPRLCDYYLGWAKRDLDILFDSDNLIVSVREPIGPQHREQFLKIGEAWDGRIERADSQKAIAAILGLINFPDDEVRSRVQSWANNELDSYRKYAAMQVLGYWDFVVNIDRTNLAVVGRWKLDVDVNDKGSPIMKWTAARLYQVDSIEFELYPDQEVAMVFVCRKQGFSSSGTGTEERSFESYARGHWTADNDTLSVNIESTIGSDQGKFENGRGHPESFLVLRDAKLDAESRIAIQSKIDLRKRPIDAPDFLHAMKATWLRPLSEIDSELTSLSTRRKRELSDN